MYGVQRRRRILYEPEAKRLSSLASTHSTGQDTLPLVLISLVIFLPFFLLGTHHLDVSTAGTGTPDDAVSSPYVSTSPGLTDFDGIVVSEGQWRERAAAGSVVTMAGGDSE